MNPVYHEVLAICPHHRIARTCLLFIDPHIPLRNLGDTQRAEKYKKGHHQVCGGVTHYIKKILPESGVHNYNPST